MKLDPIGGRVVLRRLKRESTLIVEGYTHFAEVVEKDPTYTALSVGDIVIEPEQWIVVPDIEDLIIAKIEDIPAKVSS